MSRQGRKIKIGTKVTPEEFALLSHYARSCGFGSVYGLLGSLAVCFLRAVDKGYDERFDEGMAAEIHELFDELVQEGKEAEDKMQIHRHRR